MSNILSVCACGVKGQALLYISKRFARPVKFIPFSGLLTDVVEWLFHTVRDEVVTYDACEIGADG